jgi:hypothetical protein
VPAVSASVQRHREKVLAQAEHQLRSIGKLNSGELIQLYKKFLKTENYRLHLRHKAGESGREVCSQRASLMDVILRHLLDAALQGDPTFASKPAHLVVVASGGYGRGELNPYSDIDVLFLVEEGRGGLDPRVAKVIEQILYMLWDIGFKVGHATRSVANAVEHANADMQTKTAYLESRLVAGDAALFESFRQQFIKRCVDGHVEEYVHDRLQNQTERHEKYGRTVTMQEPNVKNGCGSLRDYQNLLWIAFFKERVQTTAGLVEKKLLNEKERRSWMLLTTFFCASARNCITSTSVRPMSLYLASNSCSPIVCATRKRMSFAEAKLSCAITTSTRATSITLRSCSRIVSAWPPYRQRRRKGNAAVSSASLRKRRRRASNTSTVFTAPTAGSIPRVAIFSIRTPAG